MDVPEEPAAAIVLMAIFIVLIFSFLLALAKGWLSAAQQRGGWAILAVLFFSLCSVLIKDDPKTRAHRVGHSGARIDLDGMRPRK
jgi:uncharacterized protein YhhL (DUF1145 family)